jgi:hypothetical protein
MTGSIGRVEDRRGSLGPVANAPFPIPAHRTGRADFRHPALRLASPQGTRRRRPAASVFCGYSCPEFADEHLGGIASRIARGGPISRQTAAS